MHLTVESRYKDTYEERRIKRLVGRQSRELGRRSEESLFYYFSNKKKFPWIKEVVRARKYQEGYDFILMIDAYHPLAMYLESDVIYVDAKSSSSGVNQYFHEQATKRGISRDEVITERKRLAIHTGPSANEEEVDVQLVLQLLILCDAINDYQRMAEILSVLSDELALAYEHENDVVLKYMVIYFRAID